MADTGQDLTVYAGDDATIDFALVGSDGTALDLTGATLRWALAGADLAAFVTKSSASSSEIEITDAPGGLASVFLLPADTAALAAGNYRHELEMTGAGGKTETLATGRLTIAGTILH